MYSSSRWFYLAALSLFLIGCSGKGNMGHVKVESTDFAKQQGLTVDDWSWSGGKFSVKMSTSANFTGTWNLFAQTFDASGKAVGSEVRFLNSKMSPGKTDWCEVPDLKLTEQTGKVVFDIQSATQLRRQPHY